MLMCYTPAESWVKGHGSGVSGWMVTTDNTAYQALVLVWLWCGNNVENIVYYILFKIFN